MVAGDEADCSGGGGEDKALASQQTQVAPHGAVGATTDATTADSTASTTWVSMGTVLLGVPLAPLSIVLRWRYRRRQRRRRQE